MKLTLCPFYNQLSSEKPAKETMSSTSDPNGLINGQANGVNGEGDTLANGHEEAIVNGHGEAIVNGHGGTLASGESNGDG